MHSAVQSSGYSNLKYVADTTDKKEVRGINKKDASSPFHSNANIRSFLENDIVNIKRESWTRLDKTTKLKKLREFLENEIQEERMTKAESESTYEYIRSCLDKKRPHHNKSVKYDVTTEKVVCIKDKELRSVAVEATLKQSNGPNETVPTSYKTTTIKNKRNAVPGKSTQHTTTRRTTKHATSQATTSSVTVGLCVNSGTSNSTTTVSTETET